MAKYSPTNIKERSLDEIKSEAFRLKAALETVDSRSKEGQWNLRALGIIRAELRRRNLDPVETLGLTSDPQATIFNSGQPTVVTSNGQTPKSGILIHVSGKTANALLKEIDLLSLDENSYPALTQLEKDLDQKVDELLESL